jgi:hypothetical protein
MWVILVSLELNVDLDRINQNASRFKVTMYVVLSLQICFLGQDLLAQLQAPQNQGKSGQIDKPEKSSLKGKDASIFSPDSQKLKDENQRLPEFKPTPKKPEKKRYPLSKYGPLYRKSENEKEKNFEI